MCLIVSEALVALENGTLNGAQMRVTEVLAISGLEPMALLQNLAPIRPDAYFPMRLHGNALLLGQMCLLVLFWEAVQALKNICTDMLGMLRSAVSSTRPTRLSIHAASRCPHSFSCPLQTGRAQRAILLGILATLRPIHQNFITAASCFCRNRRKLMWIPYNMHQRSLTGASASTSVPTSGRHQHRVAAHAPHRSDVSRMLQHAVPTLGRRALSKRAINIRAAAEVAPSSESEDVIDVQPSRQGYYSIKLVSTMGASMPLPASQQKLAKRGLRLNAGPGTCFRCRML
jgi:hypothetical protein